MRGGDVDAFRGDVEGNGSCIKNGKLTVGMCMLLLLDLEERSLVRLALVEDFNSGLRVV